MTEPDMELYDLRVTVDSISGRSVCGLAVGDYFEVTESSRLRLPQRPRRTEVPVPDGAPVYDRLAGWFGRDPGWTAPGVS